MTFVYRVIVPIVEGPGDQAAAPVLLRRLLGERMQRGDLGIASAINANGKGALVKKLEAFVGYARKTPRCAAILILLDADDDCPVELGECLAKRAEIAAYDVPTVVVCANREYENWFLASDDDFEGNPDEFGGASGWLTNKKPHGLIYRKRRDQPGLSRRIDIEVAMGNSRSFRRLCHAVEELVQFIDEGEVGVTPAS